MIPRRRLIGKIPVYFSFCLFAFHTSLGEGYPASRFRQRREPMEGYDQLGDEIGIMIKSPSAYILRDDTLVDKRARAQTRAKCVDTISRSKVVVMPRTLE